MKSINQLIKKVRKGDRLSQRALYEQFRSRWYLICLRYNGHEQDAQDCLQNALVKIYSHLEQFDPAKGDFAAWSSRIVINENLQFIKKKKQNPFFVEQEFVAPNDQFTETEAELSMEKLTHLLQKLPQGYRTIFNLHAIEGYDHREIAELLDISVGTSKSQLSRARNMLKKQVELYLNTV